jgi:hypothetical protein
MFIRENIKSSKIGTFCLVINFANFLCGGIVCMYSYQPEGWLDPHTVPAPDAHTHTPMHTHIPAHAHAATHS